MDVPSYPPPVDKLLTLGDGRKVAGTMNQWSTYLELGLGPEAIPPLTTYLADDSHLDEARITAISCLEKIGTIHPEARTECVAVLSRQLEAYKENDPEVNAFLISSLIDLKALEAASVIER